MGQEREGRQDERSERDAAQAEASSLSRLSLDT